MRTRPLRPRCRCETSLGVRHGCRASLDPPRRRCPDGHAPVSDTKESRGSRDGAFGGHVVSAAELVRVTIDEQEVHVPKHTGLIETALAAGIEIPVFCYEPRLGEP